MIGIIGIFLRDFAYRKCKEGGLRHQIKKLFQELSTNFLERVRIMPEEVLKAMYKNIKEHRDKHIKSKHEKECQWKELCEKNFAKSLDHRAFYFKQAEKKSTSTKFFYSELKERYDKRNLEATPDFIKKGGSTNSVYYNSFLMLPPEQFHCTLIPGDEIGKLTNIEIAQSESKLPQLQLRLDDNKAFSITYKLIAEQIVNGHNPKNERDNAKLILDKIMIRFFKFDVEKTNLNDLESFNEEEIRIIMETDFLQDRVKNPKLTFTEFWGEIKRSTMKDVSLQKDKDYFHQTS